MRDDQFDTLTRSIAGGVSRRELLRLLSAGVLTGLASLVGAKRLIGDTTQIQEFAQVLNPWEAQVVCPECGICDECNVNLEQVTATCNSCSEVCRAETLCAAANRNGSHQLLAHYLYESGFEQVPATNSDATIVYEDGSRIGSGFTSYFVKSGTNLTAMGFYFEIDVDEYNLEYHTRAVVLQDGEPLQEHYIDSFGQVQTLYPPARASTSLPSSFDNIPLTRSANQGACELWCEVMTFSDVRGSATCTMMLAAAEMVVGGLPAAIALLIVDILICNLATEEAEEICLEKCCPNGEFKSYCIPNDPCHDFAKDVKNCGTCGHDCGTGCVQCVAGHCEPGCGAGLNCSDEDQCEPECPPCTKPVKGGCVNCDPFEEWCCGSKCISKNTKCCDGGNGGKICCPNECNCCGPGAGGGCQTTCTGEGEPCGYGCG